MTKPCTFNRTHPLLYPIPVVTLRHDWPISHFHQRFNRIAPISYTSRQGLDMKGLNRSSPGLSFIISNPCSYECATIQSFHIQSLSL